jgi:carbon storage regulator CsrA
MFWRNLVQKRGLAQKEGKKAGKAPSAHTMEQSSTLGWELHVGESGQVIGMKTFGAAAPLKELQRKFGFEPSRVVAAAMEQLSRKNRKLRKCTRQKSRARSKRRRGIQSANRLLGARLQQEGQIMLVLTRRLGEEIVIADNIRVTILALSGQKVRLGIEAPASIQVVRQELRERPGKFSASPESSQNPDTNRKNDEA